MDNNIKVSINDDNLTIEFPIDLLLFTQENREDIPLRITDKNKMFKWIQNHILEYNNEENGSTALTMFIDNIFQNAYEQGEAWLEGIVFEETD